MTFAESNGVNSLEDGESKQQQQIVVHLVLLDYHQPVDKHNGVDTEHKASEKC